MEIVDVFPEPAGLAHATVVGELQAAVVHSSACILTDKVFDTAPKLSPLSVTLPAPLVAPLCGSKKLATGVSKENTATDVPTTAPTVSCAVPIQALLLLTAEVHATVLADVHAAVPHISAVVKKAVDVKACDPKLSPVMVMSELPVGTRFAGAVGWLRTGASYVKRLAAQVPIALPTVI